MKFSLPHFSCDFSSLLTETKAAEIASLNLAENERRLRDRFSHGSVGFYDWPVSFPKETVTEMRKVAEEIVKSHDAIVVIGIGGSYLGPAAVVDALCDQTSPQFIWVNNVDGAEMARVEKQIAGKKAAAIVISKSGGTVETLSAFYHLSRSLDLEATVVITDPVQGELRRLSNQQKWKAFEVPPSIGGRFSVLTAVGLFPVFARGIDAEELLLGAKEARAFLDGKAGEANPAYVLAALHYLLDTKHGIPVHYLMPYQKNLALFADWWVQLWGESLGKKNHAGKSVGFTPARALGTNDQHSLLQLFKEGPLNKVVGFLDVTDPEQGPKLVAPPFKSQGIETLYGHRFTELNSLAGLATEKSLNRAKVPTYRITLPKVSAEALGALFFFFETACAFAGELYEVNAFDQPGVEEAKRLFREALSSPK